MPDVDPKQGVGFKPLRGAARLHEMLWRREWDSNPRRLAPHGFSRAAHLSALPSLRAPARVAAHPIRSSGHRGVSPDRSASISARQAVDPPPASRPRGLGLTSDGRARRSGRRVRAEELDAGQLGVEVAQAVADHRVGDVALEVDDEAVVAECLLGRPRLELAQVDVAGRELAEDGVEAARDGRRSGSRRCWSGRGRWGPGSPTGPRETNRVWLSGWSSTSSTRISSP